MPNDATVLGHFWTLAMRARGELAKPDGEAWNWHHTLDDPLHGSVRLTGRFDHASDDRLLIVLHGLGGCARSTYCVRFARWAVRRGWSCLRLNLRGADREGEDFYHAALEHDLQRVLGHPQLEGFRTIGWVGYSLGAHLMLRHLATEPDPRVTAAVAISPPLDLSQTVDFVDNSRLSAIYRWFLLRKNIEAYLPLIERGREPVPLATAQAVKTMREWDERIVAPRWGFASANAYYSMASAGPHLQKIRTPTLVLVAEADPMIPSSTLRPYLDPAPEKLEVHWVARGGHVALPGIDIGQPVPPGLEVQILSWLEAVDKRTDTVRASVTPS